MITAYHGSHMLFEKFDLSKVGESTDLKFGFGVYLTTVEASAVHYSQPRKQPPTKDHYIYTVEIPDVTEDNHIFFSDPVPPAIIKRAEAKLGQPISEKIAAKSGEFRKWVGLQLTGCKKRNLESERAAAEFLDSIGVLYIIVPRNWMKPEGELTYAVFNADNVRIVKVEHIEVFNGGTKEKLHWNLVEGSRKLIAEYK